jgi:hypothetical protein
VKFSYKILPVPTPHPAFPNEKDLWMPVLPIRLSYGHSRQTPRIEALIDSGAVDSLFQADIGNYIGIKLKKGVKGEMGGLVRDVKIDVYYHDVNLWVGADMIKIRAGFCEEMSTAAILGRRGFFEHFTVTFDPANNPPGFEIERLGRA